MITLGIVVMFTTGVMQVRNDQRYLGMWLGFAAVIVTCFSCGDEAGGTRLKFDQSVWVDAWVRMWNSYDLDEVSRLFLEDQRLSYFSSERKGVIQGIEDVREHHVGFGFVSGGKTQPNRLWLEDVRADAFEDAVVVTGIWYFQRESGEMQRGPVTIVFVPVDGEFRIAHMNFAEYREDDTM